jgi:CRP/FNR family transcriptional regulator
MNVGDLREEQRAALLAHGRPRKLARGEYAYIATDAADAIWFVIRGRVKIVRADANGAESIVGIRAEGDAFGELSWMQANGLHAASASAIEPSDVRSVPSASFARMLDQDADLARLFARGVARRLAAAEYELTELAGKSVPGRLVDVLGRLASEYGVTENDGSVRIALNLTHKDLADLIGTSRETLTRELSVLADVGLLRVAFRTITLVQPRAFPNAQRVRAE